MGKEYILLGLPRSREVLMLPKRNKQQLMRVFNISKKCFDVRWFFKKRKKDKDFSKKIL